MTFPKKIITTYQFLANLLSGMNENAEKFLFQNRNRIIDRPYVALKFLDEKNKTKLLTGTEIERLLPEREKLLLSGSRRGKLAVTSFLALMICTFGGSAGITLFSIKINELSKFSDAFTLLFFYFSWGWGNSKILSESYTSIIHNYFHDRYNEAEAQLRAMLCLGLNFYNLEANHFAMTSLTVDGKSAVSKINSVDQKLTMAVGFGQVLITACLTVYHVFFPPVHWGLSLIVLAITSALTFSTFIKFGAYIVIPNGIVTVEAED